jgi:hypothetical protein
MHDDDANSEIGAAPRSTRRRWWLGCGVGCVVVLLLIVVGGLVGIRLAWSYIDRQAQAYEAMGFDRRVTGQAIEVTRPITEPTLLMGQMVKVGAGSETNIAIIAQLAEIHGIVKGDVYFLGQILLIQPGAVVQGSIHVKGAQAIDLYGTVEGEINGTYQKVNRRR